MNDTVIVSHSDCPKHDPGASHPECPQRFAQVMERLQALKPFVQGLSFVNAPSAALDQIALAHDQSYVDRVVALAPKDGVVALDEDTKMSVGSLSAALGAAGAACHAVDLVMSGQASNAFCVIRPPGHHAFFDKSMGFCIFNNVAIAAAHAMKKHNLNRVAIIDFDVHHGNGTQDIVQRRLTSACFVSIQEKKLWPYNDVDQITNSRILNVGIDRDAPAIHWHEAMSRRVIPSLESYRPELIIISAGFDAHLNDPPEGILFNDPPAKQHLVDSDYMLLTQSIRDLAERVCDGRIVSCLEGGYNTPVLASAVSAHVLGLVNALHKVEEPPAKLRSVL